MSPNPPNRDLEQSLARNWGIVAGVDEVGRGALAGPVCVGVVAVQEDMPPFPVGLTDSKMLTPKRREALVAPVETWALAGAVGWSSPSEIDEFGIIAALRLAGWRALIAVNQQLASGGIEQVGGVLLDGVHDWFTPPVASLWDDDGAASAPEFMQAPVPPVVTRKKADLECAAVSAASILAKVQRDQHMEQILDPGYYWSSNKGYASPGHQESLLALGPCEQHRRSWKLPGLA